MAEYIDRQLAYETLKDYFEAEEVWTDEGHFYVDMCRELLDDIPAADVRENIKGKWELSESGDARCSRCGHITSERLVTWGVIHGDELAVGDITMEVGTPIITASKPFFCSACGADMRGKNE